MLTSNEIRKRFLDFFEKRGHAVIPPASLVTTDEKGQTNATLFNTAGMQPLILYLLGKEHPQGKRLASSQKCVRTIDIEEVGDNTHLTFFEMLGNWSLGDYFKEDAIKWSFEFMTSKDEGLGLDIKRLYVTVFAGNEDVARDEEAANIWRDIFNEHELDGDKRIFYLSSKSNWWTAGPNSPAGPSTEMFYDVTGTLAGGLTHDEFLKADQEQKVVEIWNDVFMTYKQEDGKVIGNLPQNNVDTGAGLERVAMVVQGKSNVFETDLFASILKEIQELSTSHDQKNTRIVADHLKASLFLIADGVKPSNTDRGYILRRIIRRAVVFSTRLGILEYKLQTVLVSISKLYSEAYLEVSDASIVGVFNDEEIKFRKTLEKGLKEFEKGERNAFLLFTSYGFPLEMTQELAYEMGEIIDVDNFNKKMKEHQDTSRLGAEQKFKGGLAGRSDAEIKYHTTTHLLNQALRDVLGNHIMQKGSNITPERLRFDFSHTEKLTPDEISRVEQIVNEKIKEGLPVSYQEVSLEDARNAGALGVFEDKYEDTVTMYQIGIGDTKYSLEICGGPHVSNIIGLGTFKIQKEEASSAGVRRIKAVLE